MTEITQPTATTDTNMLDVRWTGKTGTTKLEFWELKCKVGLRGLLLIGRNSWIGHVG
jgi:hypothetical protein